MSYLWRIRNHKCECGCGVIYECSDCGMHNNKPRYSPACAAKLPMAIAKIKIAHKRAAKTRQALRGRPALDLELIEAIAGRYYGKPYVRVKHARDDAQRSAIARKIR